MSASKTSSGGIGFGGLTNEKAHLPEPGEKVERKGDKQNE
jgi:hypothetical protein